VFSLLSGFCRGMDSHDDLFLASMPAATAHYHRLHRSFVVGLVDRQQTIGAVCWSGGNDKNRETFFKAQMGLGEAAFIGVGNFLRMGHLLTVLFVCRGGIYSKRILALIFCLFFLFFCLFAVRLAAYTAQLSRANPIARSLLHRCAVAFPSPHVSSSCIYVLLAAVFLSSVSVSVFVRRIVPSAFWSVFLFPCIAFGGEVER